MSHQRPQLTRSCCLIIATLLTLSAHTVSAQVEEPPASMPKGYGIIVSLPGVDNELIGLALLSPPPDVQTASKVPVALLEANDRRWLTPLRRDIYRQEVLPKLEPKCRLETPLFSDVVDQLEDAINYLDYAQAEGDRWLADMAYACNPDPLLPDHLARFAFLQGLLEQRKSHSDQGWFQAAAELDPGLARVGLESAQTQDSFRVAANLSRTITRIRVPVHVDQAGISLWIDGAPVSGTEVMLLPGVHFIQQVDLTGKALRGSMEMIGPQNSSGKEYELSLPPESFEVPHAEAVIRRAEESVRTGRLDDIMSTAFGALLAGGQHPWALILLPETLSQPARGLWILAGGSVIPVRLSHELSKAGVTGSAVMAGLTVASGIGLAYLLSPLVTGEPVQSRAARIASCTATGIGFGLSMSLTGVIASRTWHRPRFLYQQTRLLTRTPSP